MWWFIVCMVVAAIVIYAGARVLGANDLNDRDPKL